MYVCMSVRVLLSHSSKTKRDIFKIKTAYDQARPGIGHSNLNFTILPPVGRKISKWPPKTGFLPIT